MCPHPRAAALAISSTHEICAALPLLDVKLNSLSFAVILCCILQFCVTSTWNGFAAVVW